MFDRLFQVPAAPVDASPELFFRRRPDPPNLGEIESRHVGMGVKCRWQRGRGIDATQELAELDGPVAPMTLPDDVPGFHIASGKDRGNPNPWRLVVMGTPLDLC